MKTVIEMAREAGLYVMLESASTTIKELERFAALVREDEREACAKVCDWIAADFYMDSVTANKCAEAIRARGEK